MDLKFEDGLEDLSVMIAKQRLDEITKEQLVLLQALEDAGMSEDDVNDLVTQYDRDVDSIEAKTRQEITRMHGDLEKQIDAAKAKRLARLRAPQKKAAQALWATAGLVKKMGSLVDVFASTQTETVTPDEAIAAATARHTSEIARLTKALEEQAKASIKEMEMDLDVEMHKAIADAQEELITQLDSESNQDECKRLIADHDKKMKLLENRMEAEKARQLQNLESRMEARKREKVYHDLADLHKKEIGLLADPKEHAEASMVALTATTTVRQEIDAARLNAALLEQVCLPASLSVHSTEKSHSCPELVSRLFRTLKLFRPSSICRSGGGM